MQVCAHCGEVNADDGARCTGCGGPLVPRRALDKKQTVLGVPAPSNAPAPLAGNGSQQPASPVLSAKQTLLGIHVSPITAAPQPGSPAAAPMETSFNPKATLIGGVMAPGVAPVGAGPPGFAGGATTPGVGPSASNVGTAGRSDTQVGHSPGVVQRSPELASTAILHPGAEGANVGSTLLGMPAPDDEGTFRSADARGSSIPPVPPTAGGASQLDGLPSGAPRTLLGVAVPGIAPLNPGSERPARDTNPPQRTPTQPIIMPQTGKMPEDVDIDWPGAVKGQRKSALLLLSAAAGLLVFVVAFLLLWDTAPPMQARVTVDAAGKENLELTCADCPDGSVVRIDGVEATFTAGAAALTLGAPLSIGDNQLSVSLERPGIGRDESVPLVVPVHFKLHAALGGMTESPPRITIEVQASPGSSVEVDGQKVRLNEGKASVPLELGDGVTGAASEPKELVREVSYRVTPREASPLHGKLEIRLPIVPLVVSSPGAELVTDSERFMLAGKTTAGARVSVAGKAITVDADGAFSQLMSIDSEGETTILVRADGDERAPRLVERKIRRVASLKGEAERLREGAIREYAAAASSAMTAPGSRVALKGKVEEARTTGHTTVLLLDVDEGCEDSPCLVRVLSPTKFSGAKGDVVEVFGSVRGEVEGAPAQSPILEVEASFVLQ